MTIGFLEKIHASLNREIIHLLMQILTTQALDLVKEVLLANNAGKIVTGCVSERS